MYSAGHELKAYTKRNNQDTRINEIYFHGILFNLLFNKMKISIRVFICISHF